MYSHCHCLSIPGRSASDGTLLRLLCVPTRLTIEQASVDTVVNSIDCMLAKGYKRALARGYQHTPFAHPVNSLIAMIEFKWLSNSWSAWMSLSDRFPARRPSSTTPNHRLIASRSAAVAPVAVQQSVARRVALSYIWQIVVGRGWVWFFGGCTLNGIWLATVMQRLLRRAGLEFCSPPSDDRCLLRNLWMHYTYKNHEFTKAENKNSYDSYVWLKFTFALYSKVTVIAFSELKDYQH